MGEANERRSKAMENLSLQIEKYPRDLLQRFTCGSSENTAPREEEDSEEVELNLGLSLGGRFGIDKDAKKKLIRSSSIAGTMPLVRNDEATTLLPVSYPSLIRTSSLPTETEEEWRKRKELQTLRRMEAKRRRSEKQRNTNNSVKSEKEGCFSEEDKLQQHQQHSGSASANTLSSTVAPPFGLPTWAAAARQVVHGGGVLDVISKGKAGFLGDCGGLQGFGQPSSQGSMESQGGSSSGMSDLESKPVQGSSSCGEARSLANNQSLQERSNQDLLGSSGTSKTENTLKKPDSAENRRREIGMNTLEDMPCVFTKGDGPNGRRIEGILYRYGKGEEVRIMCVCHGKFLSPAEFVKHAGGSDVAHPLRHIVVNPSSTSFL